MKKIILISMLGLLFVNCSKKDNINEGNLLSQSQRIDVSNAGLVILNSYYELLFERLNLLDNNQFISESERIKAVYCLQYLAIGLSQADESSLSLNKVLCGIDTQDSIGNSVVISDQDKALMDMLLESAISSWTSIGSSSSIDGFRGNWLVREGILTETEDHWELTVERLAYDILLSQSPFAFSVIKLPWMEKPLYVTWSF